MGDISAELLAPFSRSMLQKVDCLCAHTTLEVDAIAPLGEQTPHVEMVSSLVSSCMNFSKKLTTKRLLFSYSSSRSATPARISSSERGSKSPNSSSCGWPCSQGEDVQLIVTLCVKLLRGSLQASSRRSPTSATCLNVVPLRTCKMQSRDFSRMSSLLISRRRARGEAGWALEVPKCGLQEQSGSSMWPMRSRRTFAVVTNTAARSQVMP